MTVECRRCAPEHTVWLWNPLSLLWSGHQLFLPPVKAVGAWSWALNAVQCCCSLSALPANTVFLHCRRSLIIGCLFLFLLYVYLNYLQFLLSIFYVVFLFFLFYPLQLLQLFWHYLVLHTASLILPYITLHHLTLPYLTLHHLTLHYLTLPYLTLPYITLHYLTLPYLTLPFPLTYRYCINSTLSCPCNSPIGYLCLFYFFTVLNISAQERL